jgi:hypothetical protein
LRNSIRFYNCFYEDTQQRLNLRENYFYALLAARWISFLGYAEVSVSQINQLQCVFMNKDQSLNKQKTWEMIKSLKEKQVIDVVYDGELIKNNKMDYEKLLRISFMEFKGFTQIHKQLYDKCISDPFDLYFACLCKKFDGYCAKYETISEQVGISVTLVKEKIKKLIKDNVIKYEKGKKIRGENGKFTSTANVYYVVEDEDANEEVSEIQETTNVELPEYYTYKNKKYKVTELRDTIINKGNLYGQHYFYAHEYKDDDPEIYKLFCESRRILEEKKNFNFTKLDAEWNNYLLKKKDESKPKEDDLINSFINQFGHAIKLKSGEISNVKKCNWDDVELIYLMTKGEYDDKESKVAYVYQEYDETLKKLIATESLKYERFDAKAVREIGTKYHQLKMAQ